MSRYIKTSKNPKEEQYQVVQNTTFGKLILTHYSEKPCILLLQNNRLLAVRMISKEPSKLGGIYIGRIRDVAVNINAYFVEINKGEICFLPKSKAKSPYLTNRAFDGRLLQGDEIIVQVTTEALKTKQPTVTANINAEIVTDVFLQNALHKTCFSCLQEPPSPWIHGIRELVSEEEYSEIITDDCDVYRDLMNHPYITSLNKTFRYYDNEDFSLKMLYSLTTKFSIALEKCIWLKSGAYIMIEPTEAMTVIDVNSGKYESKKGKNDYYLQINKEAAQEIALQLRLRNISGMIMVDFINMHSREKEEELILYMQQLTKKDRVPTTVIDITPLGIMEITRKKDYKPLWEQMRGN